MTPLRQRFIKDMTRAGLMSDTQATYIGIIVKFVRHCGDVPPQEITEQQVEHYIDERLDTAARGTFQIEFAALKALFHRTLGRDWAIFTKKKYVNPYVSAYQRPSRTTNAANSSTPLTIPFIEPVPQPCMRADSASAKWSNSP